MRLVGVLSWYDESPSWLSTAVTGFARICDHIVAVDGAYALYPGARARSRPDQREAIMLACESAGVGLTLHEPNDVWWGNELEKRNYTLRLAAPLLEHGRDWVCVFDADYHIAQARPEHVRHQLASTDRLVATYTLLDGKDYHATTLGEYASTRMLDTEWTTRTRDIYRWLPGLRYVGTHYTIRARHNGRVVWLRGQDSTDRSPLEPTLDLNDALVVHHRTEHRALVRRNAADEYYKTRAAAGIETYPDMTLDATAA